MNSLYGYTKLLTTAGYCRLSLQLAIYNAMFLFSTNSIWWATELSEKDITISWRIKLWIPHDLLHWWSVAKPLRLGLFFMQFFQTFSPKGRLFDITYCV